jgi:hypothetical protein
MVEIPKKIQEKFQGKEVTFDGTYYNCAGKKYTAEGLRVIAENFPIVFNSCELKVAD